MRLKFKLKPAVWERARENLYVMLDRREMKTFADPDGSIEDLLTLLSSESHTMDTLTRSFTSSHPEISAGEVVESVAALDAQGMIEGATTVSLLTPRQRERYFTNLVFFQSVATLALSPEDMQQRLLDSHVTILGVGGLGSTVLMHLAGAGVGRLTLVEPDVIEERDLSRQFIFRNADVGRSKLERAREWVRDHDSELKVQTLQRKVGSKDDVAALLSASDLVIGAADTPPLEIGSWVNAACVAAGIPWIQGTMGIQSHYVSVDAGRGACLECSQMIRLEERDEPSAVGAKWRLFERVAAVNRGVGPVAGQIGALMAMEALRYLTGFAEPVAAGIVHSFDVSSGAIETITPWLKRADCTVCSTIGTTPGFRARDNWIPHHDTVDPNRH